MEIATSKVYPAVRDVDQVYKKVIRRLLPFLFLCYMMNFMDRVNISFAHLEFQKDLMLSDAAYALGVGVFFIGYVLVEIPSNLLMKKIGARLTISRIMILWGLVSAGMMFVQTPMQFYIARILLGFAEGGFFPGIALYLTYWFPAHKRGQVTSRLFFAVAVAGVVGGPVSGWIMANMGGVAGLRGWQWLFVIEGLPASILGIVAYFYLTDRPGEAKWLNANERQLLLTDLAEDEKKRDAQSSHSFAQVMKQPRIYFIALGSMVVPWASSVINFWGPSIIKNSGVTDYAFLGLLSAIPWMAAGVFMIYYCKRSDRKMERRWHFASMCFLASLSISLFPVVAGSPFLSVLMLATGTMGYLTAVALFWTIPPAFLSSSAAAGGLGFIAMASQSGGLLAPVVFSWGNRLTESNSLGFVIVSAILILAGAIIVLGLPAASKKS